MRKGACLDIQDDDIIPELSLISGRDQLLSLCQHHLMSPPLSRHWSPVSSVSPVSPLRPCVRLLQWNVLSQSLATGVDKFLVDADHTLDWRLRRWRIVREILSHDPDIVCLQEVDHYRSDHSLQSSHDIVVYVFRFLEAALQSVGYTGYFVPKPDSPCLYVDDNNGADGCAVFYRRSVLKLESVETRVLSVWGVLSNQVAMSLLLQHQDTGSQVSVVTTHLKARSGDINVMMRGEQGRDLVSWLQSSTAPVILTGDLNAEPDEPVLETLTRDLSLSSVYQSAEFTSCKTRQCGTETKTLDYILTSPHLQTVATLSLPALKQLAPSLLPSQHFPSDHLSLVADIML